MCLVSVCVCVCVRACVRVCACVRAHARAVCAHLVHVCVCIRTGLAIKQFRFIRISNVMLLT